MAWRWSSGRQCGEGAHERVLRIVGVRECFDALQRFVGPDLSVSAEAAHGSLLGLATFPRVEGGVTGDAQEPPDRWLAVIPEPPGVQERGGECLGCEVCSDLRITRLAHEVPCDDRFVPAVEDVERVGVATGVTEEVPSVLVVQEDAISSNTGEGPPL